MAKSNLRTDNFGTGSTPDGAKWSLYGEGNATIVSGKLNCQVAGISTKDGITSLADDDFTESYIFARVYPNSGACRTVMGAWNATGSHGYLFWEEGGTIYCKRVASGDFDTNVGFFTFNATTHAWWRLRIESGVVYFDTAPSSASDPPVSGDWTNRASEAISNNASFVATAAKALYIAWRWLNDGDTAQFDGINTATTGGGGGGGANKAFSRRMRQFFSEI